MKIDNPPIPPLVKGGKGGFEQAGISNLEISMLAFQEKE
jgi:hypothetical protein